MIQDSEKHPESRQSPWRRFCSATVFVLTAFAAIPAAAESQTLIKTDKLAAAAKTDISASTEKRSRLSSESAGAIRSGKDDKADGPASAPIRLVSTQAGGKTSKLAVAPAKTASRAQFDVYSRLSEKEKLHLLLRLIDSGQYDLAEDLLKKQPLSGKYAANRSLFLEGKIAKARGDHKTAIKKFRRALADDPNLTLVRAELAHSLFVTEQDGGAKHHLQLLRGAAPTPEAAEQFDNFIDAIDARRPWNFSAYVSLAPSTNFNNGTNASVVIVNGIPLNITGNSVARSGIGIQGGGNGSYTFKLGEGLHLVTAAGVNFTQYDGEQFDDTVLNQSVVLKKDIGKNTIVGIGALAFERWIGVNEFIYGFGPQALIQHRLNEKTTVSAKAKHLELRYEESTFRDGSLTTLDLDIARTLSSTTVLYGLTGFEYGDAEENTQDFVGGYAGIAAYHEFPYGITFFGRINGRFKEFDGIFPGLTEGRSDRRLDLNIAITKRDFEIFGLAPRFEYSYIRNFSNTVFDDFETHGAQVTLTKKF